MRLISAKDIIKEFDISYQTINNYTDRGFFNVVAKSSRKRMYSYSEIRGRLAKITKWINEGYALRLIPRMLTGEGTT